MAHKGVKCTHKLPDNLRIYQCINYVQLQWEGSEWKVWWQSSKKFWMLAIMKLGLLKSIQFAEITIFQQITIYWDRNKIILYKQ